MQSDSSLHRYMALITLTMRNLSLLALLPRLRGIHSSNSSLPFRRVILIIWVLRRSSVIKLNHLWVSCNKIILSPPSNPAQVQSAPPMGALNPVPNVPMGGAPPIYGPRWRSDAATATAARVGSEPATTVTRPRRSAKSGAGADAGETML